MILRNMCRATVLGVAGVLTVAAAPPTGTLTLDVGNVRNSSGTVRLEVCLQSQFLKDNCTWAALAPARTGVTTVIVHNLPAGKYAIQAFHDENASTKLERTFLGIPKEGVGFSNDAKIRFGPPKFADAAFDFGGTAQTARFNLRYFLGASGPAKAR